MKNRILFTLAVLLFISLSSAYYYTNYNEDYYIPSHYNAKIINNYYFDDYQAPHFYYPQGRYYQLNPEDRYRERVLPSYHTYTYRSYSSYNDLSPYYSDWHVMMYR